MIVGFNHNVSYRSVDFHVQTEDSGLKSPNLVTLLYHGGIIISSQKTSYADIVKVDNLDHVIEELAKEQHKGMLRRLTKGEFDARIVELGIPFGASARNPDQEAAQVASEIEKIDRQKEPVIESKTEASSSESVSIIEEPIVDKFNQPKVSNEPSLDDVIYAYLTAGQRSG